MVESWSSIIIAKNDLANLKKSFMTLDCVSFRLVATQAKRPVIRKGFVLPSLVSALLFSCLSLIFDTHTTKGAVALRQYGTVA